MHKINLGDDAPSKMVQDITIAMVDAFRDQLDKADSDVLKKEFSIIISSILSSVNATLIHMWADTVIDREVDMAKYIHEYGVAVERMLLQVGENVISTYEAKMQMINNKREVH